MVSQVRATFLVVILSFSAFLAVYKNYAEFLKPKLVPLGLPISNSTYGVFTSKGCIGWARGEREKGEKFSYLLKGETYLKLKGKPYNASFTAELLINSLGQLTASVFKLSAEDLSIFFGTQGSSSVRMVFRAQVGGQQINFTKFIRGPIKVRVEKKGIYLVTNGLEKYTQYI
ncbi:MAG: hypothetical protein D6780_06855, partial [Candidatus Dadabacteria bacterium]